jgi:very-short-patch-repair endonuclease
MEAEAAPPRDEAPSRLLERMRLRLLDLSARNPLLNYTHPRASSLRIVDEIPTLVLETLIAGRSYRFAPLKSPNAPAPVAEPAPRGFARRTKNGNGRANGASAEARNGAAEATNGDADARNAEADAAADALSERERREAARAARAEREEKLRALAAELGIDPSYDLRAEPASDATRHGDARLQTLLTPDELETRLQKMQASAVTAIQESGANMLHLLFGFVEWTDVAGEKTRAAPLVLLPVMMSRLALDPATHTYPYTVAASGEDWSTNVTLQEMCRKNFGFALPGVEAEEDLEHYFTRVEEVLRTAAPGWTLRRQLTLGLVSFGKILMWRDLDPATWPAQHPLLDVPLLRQVLGGDDPETENGVHAETGAPRVTEYNIDALPAEIRRPPPIVVPADSSQHSVLIDVHRGENLVVQGPPGTGKSQTITNMIADAIASGRKVLFVAEKKAALDVVLSRLVDAGLGPFCLALHSHTSNKREFLDDLKARIAIRPTDGAAAELATVEGLLAETRRELTAHVDRLHRQFGSLGVTAFDILWRARRLGNEMPDGVVAALRGATIANVRMVTPSEAAKHRAALQAFAAAHAAIQPDIPPGATHPWHGMSRADLTFDDAESLVSLSRRTRQALERAEAARKELASAVSSVAWPDSPEGLTPLLARVRSIVPPDPSVPAALIDAIHSRAGESATRAAVAAADAARTDWDGIEGPWSEPGKLSPDEAKQFASRLADAVRMLGDGATVGTLKEAVALLSDVIDHLAAVQIMATALAAKIGVTQPLSVGLALALIEVATEVASLPESALELRCTPLQSQDAGEKLTALAARAAELQRMQTLVDARFNPEMRPPDDELHRIAGAFASAPRVLPGLLSGKYRHAVTQYQRMSSGRRADRATMLANVESLIRFNAAYDAFMDDPALNLFFGNLAQGFDSPFGPAIAVFEWARRATTLFRGGGPAAHALTDAIWMTWSPAWLEASTLALTNAEGRLAASVLGDDLTAASRFRPGDILLWEPLSFEVIEDHLHRWRDIALTAIRVATNAKAAPNVTLASLADRLAALQRAWASDAALESHAETFRALDVAVPVRSATEQGDPLRQVRGALAYLGQFHERGLPRTLVEWLASGDQRERVKTLLQRVDDVAHSIEVTSVAEQAFSIAAGVDARTWYGEWPKGAAFTLRIARFDRAIDATGTLGRWAARLRARVRVMMGPIPAAVELLESGVVTCEQLPLVYDYLLARTLAEAVLRERPELDRFSGSVHETRRAQFAQLDEKLIALTRQVIAQRANAVPAVRGVGYGPVSELSEQSLIEHEIDKTRRHIPIREMFRRAGRAIQALKPCVMMGPQAVAQYLPPGLFHFDLVVMDEASQMRPEDALGALARGAQLVVVGDPKQLGPTTFFDTVASDEDEIEELAATLAATAASTEPPPSASVLERSESILLAAARRYPLRMLRWHYRSRYPELIAFSNHEFYGDGLVLFPHPGTEREGDGIKIRRVEGATYATSLNPREAQEIVEAVRAHAAKTPERTLMVVTMNQPQRELVDTLVQNAEKDDPVLAAFRARHEGTLEPFAVKNLENVQGDERDTIFVGVTYGPSERGTLAQNFGPINATGGERRLNVLFTRAKFRLDVFCSFDPTMLRIGESSPRGLCVLHDYLRFAQEKHLGTGRLTAREPGSDFEVEVSRALRAQGYEVHPQVGVAGYYLDLAVVDPNRPGRYVLGIECDGATYHSARSARDRDRLRQQVLQNLGWEVHRIWSTDWFRDPRGETGRVVRRIESLLD